MKRRNFLKMGAAAGVALALRKNVMAQFPPPPDIVLPYPLKHRVGPADRKAAAQRLKELGIKPGPAASDGISLAAIDPRDRLIPHYFGPYANYANSPNPKGPITSIVVEAGGRGYTMPQVTIHDVWGTGGKSGIGSVATFSVTVDADGVITDILIVDGGLNYSAPLVVIEDTNPDPLLKGSGAVATASIAGIALVGGLHKFVDSIAGLDPAGANTLGQFIPVAVSEPFNSNTIPVVVTDYYEIALVEYKHLFHRDLTTTPLTPIANTTVRGYVQIATAVTPGAHIALTYPDGVTPILDIAGQPVFGVTAPHYLGPLIVAARDRAVRVKFTNYLPSGAGGDLFIPVDKSIMGAGMGPTPKVLGGMETFEYTQNRATLHMHGIRGVWISDGTPHQWITPAGDKNTAYPKGVSVVNVPDMADPGDGSMTFYYNNQQSARLMFYHDHSFGITRLNVYAGEAAGYLLTDAVEQDLIGATNLTGVKPVGQEATVILPDGVGFPLIIQDKTFVDKETIYAQDPTWKWGLDTTVVPPVPVTGSLWVPSVYMPAQNPWDLTGANAFGRWQYGPWFWPATSTIDFLPVANVFYQPDPALAVYDPAVLQPSMPSPSMGMEAYNDTPLVNGVAYPYMEVDPRAYRFRILNAANDRFFNLQLYIADPETVTSDGRSNTEVKMVPAQATPGFPAKWSTNGRDGGVPDPATMGPSWIQIGTEGGFLPAPVVIPPQPINWNLNATAFNVGNVTDHSLLLGCAERADVIVDFGAFAGQTIILYNDAPAAFPALDPRYDYYTGSVDQTETGGAPTTQPGYGPNTRTVMQFRVKSGDSAVGTAVAGITVLNGGSDYQTAPEVVLSGGLGLDPAATVATATATCMIDHVAMLTTGSGYTTAPGVTFASVNGVGSGAAGNAIVKNGRVTSIKITNKGSGYTVAPLVSIAAGTTTATAEAALTVSAVTLLTFGAGYLMSPQVSFEGGGGYGTLAVAKLVTTGGAFDLPLLEAVFAKTAAKPGVFEISQEPIIIPQAAYNSAYNQNVPDNASTYIMQTDWTKTFYTGPVNGVNLLASGSGYISAPTVAITGGGGSGAVVTAAITGAYVNGITLTNRGFGYSSTPPLVTITGGTGIGATALASLTRTVSTILVTNGGSGYNTAPTVRFSTGSGSGATATAILTGTSVTSITVTNGGTYSGTPTISFSGGGGGGARATATMTRVISNITVTNNGSGYSSAPGSLPTVTIAAPTGGLTTDITATATASVLTGAVTGLTVTNPGTGYITKPTVSFSSVLGTGAAAEVIGTTIGLEPKAIHDEMGAAYDIEYGRMGGLLGLELPVVNSLNQNMVLHSFIGPPLDLLRNSMSPLGTLGDGTQIWKITQNGVDTHPMHFHLFNVQVINRVGWDGALLPPEPNELGWKETVRTNPLEHLIIAMRPEAPTQPFDVPNSVRLIDPTKREGERLRGGPQGYVDPTGIATTVRNHKVNFGCEYVWHCHILSHEEMDMMHTLCLAVAPKAPSNLTAAYDYNLRRATITWINAALNATGFKVERARFAAGPWATLATVPVTVTTAPYVYTDSKAERNRTYYYRVLATNVVGDTQVYPGAAGYPTISLDSVSTAGVSLNTSFAGGPGTPVIFANGFDLGLAGWGGTVGNVVAAPAAAMVPGAGQMGLIATPGTPPIAVLNLNDLPAEAAYMIDNTPNLEAAYNSKFFFNPMGAISGEGPVEIFVGLTETDEPIFGVQYLHEGVDYPYQLRAWILQNGEKVYTNNAAITNTWCQIDLSWRSGIEGDFSLVVDEKNIGTLYANTDAYKLDQILLGPSMGLTASTAGPMYFDEFTSTTIDPLVNAPTPTPTVPPTPAATPAPTLPPTPTPAPTHWFSIFLPWIRK